MSRFLIIATIVAAFIASINAACDNACSGHGICTYEDKCECWDNWKMGLEEGGDCSDRVCPFDIAWVDAPNADGRSHRYAECSGRGLCDRTSGLCTCFEGFEGKSCQRTTCPNDCSGHGRCMFLNELPVGSVYTDGFDNDVDVYPKVFGDAMKYWDADKTRGCVCDSLYYGVDCSMRMCPFGTDILDLKRADSDVDNQYTQIQKIELVPFNGTTVDDSFGGKSFALIFKSRMNETFTTIPIYFPTSSETVYGESTHYETWVWNSGTNSYEAPSSFTHLHSGFAEAIEDALISLPNEVIDDVYVQISLRYASNTNATWNEYINIDVTFSGDSVQGPQNLLMVQTDTCDVGCTPKLEGLHLQEYVVDDATVTFINSKWSKVTEQRASEFYSYECGRRGKCDYNTGICSCFTGYTGEACNVQTALV